MQNGDCPKRRAKSLLGSRPFLERAGPSHFFQAVSSQRNLTVPQTAQQRLFPDEVPHGESADLESVGRIYTIGHSTRKLEELIAVLTHYRIERLVDIRHFPSSRHNPQFSKTVLEIELPKCGIEYRWLQCLGGYRPQGYLAYMETPDFRQGIEELERLARERPTVYMCAEVKWLQCHRRHVSEALTERGWLVTHIIDENRADRHYRKASRIKGD